VFSGLGTFSQEYSINLRGDAIPHAIFTQRKVPFALRKVPFALRKVPFALRDKVKQER